MAMFKEEIREWRCQTTNQKTWAHLNIFFLQAHHKQIKSVKKYGVLPTPPEEHHGAINHIDNIVQGMHTWSYNMDGLAQTNAVLTSSNKAVMAQLA